MNKNIKYIISILLVIPIALWFLLRSDSSTLTEKETGFAVSDTSTITKIFIADKKSNQVTLKRTNKGWVINNKFDSNPKLVEGLLGSMQRLKVKAPVPIVARDNVIKRLASIGVKVEVYETSYRINISEKLRFFPYQGFKDWWGESKGLYINGMRDWIDNEISHADPNSDFWKIK